MGLGLGCLSTSVTQKLCLRLCVGCVSRWSQSSSHNCLVPTGLGGQVCSIVCTLEALFPSGYMAVFGEYLLPTGGRAGICCMVLHALCCDCSMGTSMLSGIPWCYRSIYTMFTCSLYCCQQCGDVIEVNELPQFRVMSKSCCISIHNVWLYFVTSFQCI